MQNHDDDGNSSDGQRSNCPDCEAIASEFYWIYDERLGLTEAERHAWVKVHSHGLSIQELASRTDRDPAEVNGLLANVAEKRRRHRRDRWTGEGGETLIADGGRSA